LKSENAKKIQMQRQSDILSMLPGFLSQLLLLMNSGMTMQAAFRRIAEGYEQMPNCRKNLFTEEVCRIQLKSSQTGENPIRLFYEFGRSSGVRELSRTAGIMAENMSKGIDLWDKIAEESEVLWQERKRMAMEQIRVGESKMSFPLGILMLALLLVTAAPAMMQL
jgi:tight adherence protein C